MGDRSVIGLGRAGAEPVCNGCELLRSFPPFPIRSVSERMDLHLAVPALAVSQPCGARAPSCWLSSAAAAGTGTAVTPRTRRLPQPEITLRDSPVRGAPDKHGSAAPGAGGGQPAAGGDFEELGGQLES